LLIAVTGNVDDNNEDNPLVLSELLPTCPLSETFLSLAAYVILDVAMV
jgi:hypothetical protein